MVIRGMVYYCYTNIKNPRESALTPWVSCQISTASPHSWFLSAPAAAISLAGSCAKDVHRIRFAKENLRHWFLWKTPLVFRHNYGKRLGMNSLPRLFKRPWNESMYPLVIKHNHGKSSCLMGKSIINQLGHFQHHHHWSSTTTLLQIATQCVWVLLGGGNEIDTSSITIRILQHISIV